LLQPGRVAQVGIDAGTPILKAAGDLMGYISFFENFVQIMVLMIAWAIVLIAFFILAVQIFVTLIEFKLTTLAGFVLIPFALFNKTAFLAEKVLGNIVASGIKILVLAVIVGIGSGLFSEFTSGFSGTPTITDALALVLGALSLMGLSIFGPGIATGLFSAPRNSGRGGRWHRLAAAGIGAAGVMERAAALSGSASGNRSWRRMTAAARNAAARISPRHIGRIWRWAHPATAAWAPWPAVSGVLRRLAHPPAVRPVREAASRAARIPQIELRRRPRCHDGPSSPRVKRPRAPRLPHLRVRPAPRRPGHAHEAQPGMSHGATAAAHAVRSGESRWRLHVRSLHQDDRQ